MKVAAKRRTNHMAKKCEHNVKNTTTKHSPPRSFIHALIRLTERTTTESEHGTTGCFPFLHEARTTIGVPRVAWVSVRPTEVYI